MRWGGLGEERRRSPPDPEEQGRNDGSVLGCEQCGGGVWGRSGAAPPQIRKNRDGMTARSSGASNAVGGSGGGAAPLPPRSGSIDSRLRALPAALLLTGLMVYPFLDHWLKAQTVHAVTDAMIYVLLALGLNIVVGYAGLLDLGYAAFFAIGAYTMGLLNSPVLGSPLYGHAWSFWVVIWISALVSAALGVVIGAPTLRVRGDYLAIITLAFGEIIPVAIRNLGDITIDIGGWRPVERLNLTGGENGVNPVGRPHLPFVNFDTDFIPWYFLILIIGAF